MKKQFELYYKIDTVNAKLNLYKISYSVDPILCLISPGGHLYFRLDIILVKGLSKHSLNPYFSGTKIDPKYAFLHAFFLNFCNVLSKICKYDQKPHPFFQFCTFLHP